MAKTEDSLFDEIIETRIAPEGTLEASLKLQVWVSLPWIWLSSLGRRARWLLWISRRCSTD